MPWRNPPPPLRWRFLDNATAHAVESSPKRPGEEGLLRSWQRVGAERHDMYMYSLLPEDLPAARP